MITKLAVAGYRSLRDVKLTLGALNIVTGANGSGKSSLYRSLRLLAETAQGRLVSSLASEGGLASTLWAGPERISHGMRTGEHPIQGTRRKDPIALKLGFAGDSFGYAVDLGLPSPDSEWPFPRDPEIKVEAMWAGETLGRANLYAERRGQMVRLRRATTGEWRTSLDSLAPFDSMVTHCADPVDGLELLLMRERMRGWRFYDNLRTDREAPARRPQVQTYTPMLAGDGSDIGAAVATILAIGDADAFAAAVEDAFPGGRVGPGEDGGIAMEQKGLLRRLAATELSEGTLRYLLLITALLSPRPPELMVLNEPESSLHPSLIEPLARLLVTAAARCQIVVVSHSGALVETLSKSGDATMHLLAKDHGETRLESDQPPNWVWPSR